MIVPQTVPSTDGVQLAVHDLGGVGPVLLVAHATGFHGRAYGPMAEAIADRFHSIGFDFRGHGDTAQPNRPIDWTSYGDDATSMATAVGSPVVGFGHSMGGACLLMAAHRNPALFSHLVLFEPIVFPADARRPDAEPSPLVEGARRRRRTFDSYEAAAANYASKPPLSAFDPAALAAYVLYGFAEGADGAVHLKCPPEVEAGTFELGSSHDTFSMLADIDVPVLVIAGRVEEMQPSAIAARVADELPNGSYLELGELDHFGPMTHPGVVAAVVADAAG